MCCPAFYEPSEDELRRWAAEGCTLVEAGPDESSDEAGLWRAVVNDPRGFWIAFRADAELVRAVFGQASAAWATADTERLAVRQKS